MILGIDYAGIDGGRVEPAKTGAKFAYIRASGGMRDDPRWRQDRDAWAKVAPAGAYHWLAWHRDPVAQAHRFIASAGERRPGELPFCLDVEADSAKALAMTPAECLEHAETCLRELVEHYGCVMIYTSARVWVDVMDNAESPLFAACPLWLKVPYPWRARNQPHLESVPATYTLPRPWRSKDAVMMQFQGDAVGLPGTTSTVDLNKFLALGRGMVSTMLRRVGITTYLTVADGVRRFQRARGLVVDGIVGPRTFAALTQTYPSTP